MVKSSSQIRIYQGLVLLIIAAGFYFPILRFFSGPNPLEPDLPVFSYQFLKEFLSDSWNLDIIRFSFYQAILSALISIAVGLPGAWIMSRYSFPGEKLFKAVTFLPFILPPILVVLAMVLFWGNNGSVNRFLMWVLGSNETPVQFLYSLKGILLSHAFYNFPVAMKIIGDRWERISLRYEQAARSLGSSKWMVFWRIYFPLLLPSIASAFMLIFLLCLNSFAIILVLGGGVKFTTMEVLIYQLSRIELDFSGAASLAFLQVVISLFFVFFLIKQHKEQDKQSHAAKRRLISEVKRNRIPAVFSTLWMLLLTVFAIGPLMAVISDSLLVKKGGQTMYSLTWYGRMFSSEKTVHFMDALWNSLSLAFTASILGGFLGMGVVLVIYFQKGKTRRFIEMITMFPIALSSVVLGAVWFSLFQDVSASGLKLNVFWVAALIHALIVFPYFVRIVLPILESVPESWLMAAQSLGRDYNYFLRKVLIPWLKKPIIIGFSFSFALSLGELNSILMIADEQMKTLPLEIYGAISGYRFSYASAVGVVLLVLCVSTILFLQKVVSLKR